MGSRARRDRRGAVVLEFAILAIPFFTMVLGVCEISFDLFTQEALNMALQDGARQMEVGAALNTTGEGNFVSSFLCNTTAGRLLICKNIHVKVEVVPIDSTDYVSATDFSSSSVSTGGLPMNGQTLDLSAYDGTNGIGVFCTAPPGALIMVSAIYVGPTFLSGLLPGFFNQYDANGNPIHAVLSQVGVASENFPGTQATGAAKQC